MFQSRLPFPAILAVPTAIEAFAGAGGLSCGLRDAGFDIRLAFDADTSAVETYRTNLGHQVYQIDARKITGAELLDLAKIRVRELDLFAGGPPCQGFSKQRKRGADDWDERNELVFHHARLGAEMLPRVVVFENVPQLLDPKNRIYVERVQAVLHRYRMTAQIVDAADFGTPQRRKRAVLIFVREDVEGVPELIKSPRRLSVRDAIADLPEPPEDGSDHPEFAHHSRSQLAPINLERLRLIPEGGGWADLPDDMRLACHRRYAETGRRGGWRDVFGRMVWDEPAPTLTTGCITISKGRFAHPESDRAITPREAARLQGFPDSYRFHGFREQIARQIGNAVPVPLSKAIGEAIKCILPEKLLENKPQREHGRASDKMGEIMTDRLSEIEQQMQALERERAAIIKEKRSEAIREARRLVATFEITSRELGLSGEPDDEKSARSERGPAKIKYQSGGNTWSGRGKSPRWVRDFQAAGGNLEDIRV